MSKCPLKKTKKATRTTPMDVVLFLLLTLNRWLSTGYKLQDPNGQRFSLKVKPLLLYPPMCHVCIKDFKVKRDTNFVALSIKEDRILKAVINVYALHLYCSIGSNNTKNPRSLSDCSIIYKPYKRNTAINKCPFWKFFIRKSFCWTDAKFEQPFSAP